MPGWNLTKHEQEFLGLKDREEGMGLWRWSKVKLPKATTVTNPVQFYGDTQANPLGRWLTNMRSPNIIEDPYRVVWKRMWFRVFSDPDLIIDTEANQNAKLNAIQTIRNLIWFETKVVDKDYPEIPGFIVPAGGGLEGTLGATTNAGAMITGGAMDGGVKSIHNYFEFHPGLEVPKLKGWYIQGLFRTGGVVIPTNLDMWLELVLAGPAVREEH